MVEDLLLADIDFLSTVGSRQYKLVTVLQPSTLFLSIKLLVTEFILFTSAKVFIYFLDELIYYKQNKLNIKQSLEKRRGSLSEYDDDCAHACWLGWSWLLMKQQQSPS